MILDTDRCYCSVCCFAICKSNAGGKSMMDKLKAIVKDLEKEIKDLQILIGCSKETIVIVSVISTTILQNANAHWP
jgi:hypothetical protein